MRQFFYFIFIVFLIACKKEPTSWNTEWTSPAAHGHLTLEDLLKPEYIAENDENYYTIVFNEPVYTFTIDTIVKLPDTSFVKKSAIAVSSINVNPGFYFTDDYDQEYELDQIQLKKVRIASGIIEVNVKCPWPGASLVTFTFPKITLGGVSFEQIFEMPAASISNPAVATRILNLAGYFIDLTGTDGNQINMLSADFVMGSNESVNSYTVTSSDSVEYTISFKNLKPDYAKGYFGQYYFSDTTGISLDFMKNVTSGAIDIDSIKLNLILRNGFNLIAQTKITSVAGHSSLNSSIVNLNFPMLGTSMNINPAAGNLYDYDPSEFPIEINNSNSNIINFLENLSDSLVLGYELEINPFGNVTGGSDEVFPGSAFELVVDAEFPLNFGADQLGLKDTFEIDYDNPENVYPENGKFELTYSNGFPVGGSVYFILLDENGAHLDTLSSSTSINSGIYNETTYLTTPSSGEVVFHLDESNILNLDLATKVVMFVSFSTHESQKVKIDSDAYFDFVLRSDIRLKIEI